MAYTLRRSFRTMFLTSSTTCVAFLANALSPLMPIKSFGIFAAVIVPSNFMLVCLCFPPLIIIQETYFQKKSWGQLCCCCLPRYQKKEKTKSKKPSAEELNLAAQGDESGTPNVSARENEGGDQEVNNL